MKKQRREESERRREEERRSEEKKDQKKEDPGARKGRKVAKHCVFPMICGSGGSKSRLAKAAGVELSEMKDKQLHAIGARSTFRSPNVKNTPFSDHFWKLTCRKSARRCGAKHIWNPKCAKHTRFGALLEVEMLKKRMPSWHKAHFEAICANHTFGPLLEAEMLKKCTPLWREARFEVKMCKAHHPRTTFRRSTAPHYTTLQLQQRFYSCN